MAKYIDTDRLKAEIKRQIRMEELNFAALGGGGQTFCTNTLEWVLKQIDSLPDEKSSEDLEEAAEKWCKENGRGFVLRDKSAYYIGETLPAFLAGAKWMAERCDEETSKLLRAERQTAYIYGWDDCEERMPKWKKSSGALRYGILEDEHGRYIQHDGYKLYFDDLLKLPKEDEQ